jgi:hypothetical protein
MRWHLAFVVLLLPAPLAAQEISYPRQVDAAPPHAVAVTVYRNPEPDGEGEIDPNWPQGFALITETRRVTLPAGRSRLRFAGVAESMIGVSAVVRGLPGGIAEQNRDAALLTPASLIDGSLGNRVTIRRTDRNSGVVREEEAILRTGADGGVVLQTATGLEGLRCSGLSESLSFASLPSALRDGPTFSIDTDSSIETTVEVTLTYLATGFEWTADYVLRVDPVQQRLSLFAWATLANGNSANFPNARLSLVAGNLEYTRAQNQRADMPPLSLRCYPLSDPRSWGAGIPPPAALAAMSSEDGMEDIIVTGSRRSASLAMSAAALASEQALGDLVLYQTPFNTTVAPASQKQVALLDVANIPYRLIYVARNYGESGDDPTQAVLRFANQRGTPLARALPSGRVTAYQQVDGQTLPLGQSAIADAPPGRDVEVEVYRSELVTVRIDEDEEASGRSRMGTARVVNATPRPANVEIRFDPGNYEQQRLTTQRGTALLRREGYAYLTVIVPANSERLVSYRVVEMN